MVSVGVVDCGFYSSLEFFKVRGFKDMGSEVRGSRLGPRGFEEAKAAPALHIMWDFYEPFRKVRYACGGIQVVGLVLRSTSATSWTTRGTTNMSQFLPAKGVCLARKFKSLCRSSCWGNVKVEGFIIMG